MHTKSTALLYLLYPTYILWGVVTYILWGAFQNFNVEIEILCVNPIKMKDLDTKSLEQLELSSNDPKISPILSCLPWMCQLLWKKHQFWQNIWDMEAKNQILWWKPIIFSTFCMCRPFPPIFSPCGPLLGQLRHCLPSPWLSFSPEKYT